MKSIMLSGQDQQLLQETADDLADLLKTRGYIPQIMDCYDDESGRDFIVGATDKTFIIKIRRGASR